MRPDATLTTANCRLLTDYLALRGHDLTPVLNALGIDAGALADTDRRIPRLAFNQALELAMSLTGDDFLGLHLGEHIRPAHYGALGYVLMSCETPRQVMERHARWHQLVHGGEQSSYTVEHGQLKLSQQWPGAPGLVTRAAGECHMASAVSFARWIFGRDIDPLALHFPYPAPADLHEYQRLFRCPLHFDSTRFGISIDAALLDIILPQADAELRALMEARAQRQATELGLHSEPFIAELRRQIAARIPDQVPNMRGVAQALNISSHTLQRRLAQRGSNFKQELDTVRQDLARNWLLAPDISLIEIAFLLGFSQQSAFNRAFKRWCGLSPQAYRQSMQAKHTAGATVSASGRSSP